MRNKKFLICFKVFFALLGFAAIVTEIATTVERDIFNAGNFFSFFTVQSNIFAAGMLLIGAFALAAGIQSKTLDLLRGAATLYMVTTGVVFAILLSGLENVDLTAVPWDNTVLHYIMPVVLLVDWLIDRPHKTVQFTKALWWLSFPLAYVVYSLIRGSVVGWYPYPFLNVTKNGYGGVLVTSVCIAVFVTALTWLLVKVRPLRTK